MKTRLHPSLSLVISACVVGVVGGVELATIPGLITSGFGSTLAITGFLVSIPIFADSALILLAPLVKSISQAKKKSLTGLALDMACALNITHASVPPTPGPLAVVAQFGDTIDLGAYILFGIVMGLPVMILIAIMSRVAGRRWYKIVDEAGEIVDVAPDKVEEYARLSSQPTIPQLDPGEQYPSALMSFAPIFIPVVLS